MTSAAHFAASVSRFADEAPDLLSQALRGGGAYGDLFYEHSMRQQMALRQGVGRPAFRSSRQADEGVGLRILSAGGSGFASTSDLSAAAIRAAAIEVASQGRGGPVMEVRRVGETPSPESYAAPADAPDQIGELEKRALLQEAADAAFSFDPRVRSVEVGYQDHVRRTLVVTSEGTMVAVAHVLMGLRVDVAVDVGGRRAHAYAVGGTAGGFGHFLGRPGSELAREAVQRALILAEARLPAAGPMPLVIAAGWGGVWLHETVGHLLEADAARPIAAASRGITLVDDGTLPGGRGSAPFDDEATPAARTVLVHDGEPLAVMTDRYYAISGGAAAQTDGGRKGEPAAFAPTGRGRRRDVRHGEPAGIAPTGNGRRQDFRHEPLPRMTNLILEPGNVTPADLISEAGEGLYVAAVGRGKILPDEDRFVFDVLEAYRIEGGRLTAPVCGVRIEGTASTVLAGIRGVGSDLAVDTARGICRKKGQTVPVSVGTPTVLVEGMEIVRGR